ncbi:DUF1223 domain-containing protein [Pseudooceanicola antarcticus]|nr:DUF1223 domain-containing protein [Pseudooceanicola antarcticus]
MLLAGVLGLASALFATKAPAQEAVQAHRSPVVVELFTSQGCSSCPPADRMLADMAGIDQLLPLALHVDYWDYLGWKDALADPMFTRRQKAYARATGSRMIYTPQIVINGTTFVKGAHPKEVAEHIALARRAPVHVSLDLRNTGEGRFRLEAMPLPGLETGPMQVTLVHFIPMKSVEILRGENAGSRIDYANIVTYWKPVAEWDGRRPLELDLRAAQDHPGAVLLQRAGFGAIEAAARLP